MITMVDAILATITVFAIMVIVTITSGFVIDWPVVNSPTVTCCH